MGIPHLTSYISPFALITVLGCSTPACEAHSPSSNSRSNQVIIDGPAFAYTVNDRLTALKSSPDASAAIPSYDEVGKAALAFLVELETHGLTIKRIYFDGFLPPQKTKTRISRLEKQVRRLSSFRGLHRLGFPNVFQAQVSNRGEISQIPDRTPSQATCRKLPAAPFFVAAILETIKTSKYASITEIVPGEAEAYCAAMARQSGGMILSNDSDLLVHDLGPDGTVGSITALEVIFSSAVFGRENCATVQTTVVKPQNVALQLGLKDMKSLACVLAQDSRMSILKAIEQARNIQQTGDKYQEILNEYSTEPTALESCMFSREMLSSYRAHSATLDPRLSELILQSDKGTASVYLPVLIEDPSQTSAFVASAAQRRFAYSCCTILHAVQDRWVLEYRRKGLRILPHSIKPMSQTEILQHSEGLHARVQHFKIIFSRFSEPLIWRVYALADVYHWCLNRSRTPPSRGAMAAVIMGKSKGLRTWDDINLCAQIEASLYSLRMIQQILAFGIPFNLDNDNEWSVTKSLIALNQDLKDLPPLKHLMPSPSELSTQTADLDVDEILDSLANILQDDINEENIKDEKSEDEKSKDEKIQDEKTAGVESVEGLACAGSKKRRRRRKG